MQVRTLNVNKMIKLYDMREVKTHMLSGPGSLFDPDIFGSRTDKRLRFGYINLKGRYIEPSLYAVSSRVFRELQFIVDGTKRYKIVNGDLVQDPDGDTGIDWFYQNFEKISFKKIRDVLNSGLNRMQSNLMKKSFLKLTKNDFFVDKIVVMPVKFRDIDSNGETMVQVDTLNQYYIDLLKTVANKERFKGNTFMDIRSMDIKIQGIIQKIYDYMCDIQFGKTGAQRNLGLSRSVDNCARTVIVSPTIEMDDEIGQTDTKLNQALAPLHHIMNMHPIHTVTGVKKILTQLYNNGLIEGDKDEFEYFYNEDYIKEEMQHYYDAPALRLAPVHTPNGGHIELTFKWEPNDKNTQPVISTRPLTWMELFYMATSLYIGEATTVLTRYPVVVKSNLVAAKLKINTMQGAKGKCKVFFNKEALENDDPFEIMEKIVDVNSMIKVKQSDLPSLFEEATRFSNLYLSGMDGDYRINSVVVLTKNCVNCWESDPMIYKYYNVTGNSERECLKNLY